MSSERPNACAALRQEQARHRNGTPSTTLSREKLVELAALQHVECVLPTMYDNCHVMIGDKSQAGMVSGARPADEFLSKRIVAGHGFEKADEASAIVSEFFLYRLGLVDEASAADVIGKTLHLELHSQHQSATGLRLFLLKPDRRPAVARRASNPRQDQGPAARIAGEARIESPELAVLRGTRRRVSGRRPSCRG